MKTLVFSTLGIAVIVGCCATLSAQSVDLVYRERNAATWLVAHGRSGMVFAMINRVGVFRLVGPDMTPVPLAATMGADGFQYHNACDCSDGDILLHQRGFLGERLFRIDSLGEAHPIRFEGGRLGLVTIRGNGTAYVTIFKPDSSYQYVVTVDCGRTWFATNSSQGIWRPRVLLMDQTNPLRYSVVRPGLGNQEYPLPVMARGGGYGLGSIGFHRSDSIVWTSSGRTNFVSDTIWYCNITDSLRKGFDTVLSVIGVSDSLDPSTVQLVNTPSGKLYMFSEHRPSPLYARYTWYARYSGGVWTRVDSCPRDINFLNTMWDSDVTTPEYQNPDWNLVTLHLDRDKDQIVRQKVEPELKPSQVNGVQFVSPAITRIAFNLETNPSVFFSASQGLRTLNDVVWQIEQLDLVPSLLGFVGTDGYPVIVGVHDIAISKVGTRPGLIRSFSVRGEKFYGVSIHGPRVQSTRGLRTPYIGNNEVIFPGATVGLYDQAGRFVRTLHNGPATAVVRTAAKKLLIANGPVVRAATSETDTVVFDLSSIGCSTADTAGFVSSMVTLTDGSVLAFVNGLEIQDAETFLRKPYRCGFIARTTDEGRTWARCEQPLASPYFLGHIVLEDGSIVASATTVVRDTLPQEFNVLESKNHTLNDRTVIRSTDMGRSWATVHSSPSSSSYRFIGGEGVVAEDGSLKLLTTDGLLRSTDQGLTWDLHNEAGIDGSTLISMFQQAPRSRVYYCTNTGVYATALPSSVAEDQTETRSHQAKTWATHLSQWTTRGSTVAAVYSLVGQRMEAVEPTPGPYVVVLDNHGTLETQLVLVLAE